MACTRGCQEILYRRLNFGNSANMNTPSTPLAVILFGFTGDLTRTKLIPSLWQLWERGEIDPSTRFFGYGRRHLSQDDITAMIIKGAPGATDEFVAAWHYIEGQIDDEDAYRQLEHAVSKFDHRLVYLAVGPELYETIVGLLAKTNVLAKTPLHKIVIEKPFGNNALSAEQLQVLLLKSFHDNQIYRIDHYLGKADLRELAASPPKTLTAIDAFLTTTEGVGNRGSFLDSAGIIRDIVQNHALASIATALASAYFRETSSGLRNKMLKKLQVIPSSIKLGQYNGYTEEKDVASGSTTPMMAQLEFVAHLDADAKVTLIAARKWSETKSELVLTTHLGEQVVSLTDPTSELKPHALLLLEAIKGDQTWFVSYEEALTAWHLVAPLLNAKPSVKY